MDASGTDGQELLLPLKSDTASPCPQCWRTQARPVPLLNAPCVLVAKHESMKLSVGVSSFGTRPMWRSTLSQLGEQMLGRLYRGRTCGRREYAQIGSTPERTSKPVARKVCKGNSESRPSTHDGL